ncbi:MAG: hypothetical protein P4L76_15105 [Beijerinckiaceae bacterium]|nr:hypothetical protein [Beijerinckiaceae bacterium]
MAIEDFNKSVSLLPHGASRGALFGGAPAPCDAGDLKARKLFSDRGNVSSTGLWILVLLAGNLGASTKAEADVVNTFYPTGFDAPIYVGVNVASATAYGQSATVGDGATAVGAFSKAVGGGTTAIGSFATATDKLVSQTTANLEDVLATAVGNAASATGLSSTAVGQAAVASGAQSTATGQSAQATGYQSAAFGGGAYASDFATASGALAQATGASSVAVGDFSQAGGHGSIALGQSADAAQNNSIAIGQGVTTTRANQVLVGNAANTYTLPGIASAASLAAQSGATKFVTTDAGGNLASSAYGPNDIASLNSNVAALQSSVRRAYEGTAIAIALAGSALPADKLYAISANYGTFRGENGFGAVGQLRISDNVIASGGIGAGLARGGVGGRAGVTVAW